MEKAKKPPALQAVRGNEIQQLYICSQLVKQLKELENKGCINANKEIMVIPAINPFSINTGKRFWGVGDIDINRSFREYVRYHQPLASALLFPPLTNFVQ